MPSSEKSFAASSLVCLSMRTATLTVSMRTSLPRVRAIRRLCARQAACSQNPSWRDGYPPRGDLEIAAASWLAVNSPDGEMQVRFDTIDMLVVSADRALLRHHINAFSCGVEQPTSIPAPAGGPGAPRGHSEGLFPCLSAVPHDSLVDREDAVLSSTVLSATLRTAVRSVSPCAP